MRQLIGRALLILVGLGGCTVGPNYHTPTAPLPVTWSELPESGVKSEPMDITHWWLTLGDPLLNSLVERAVVANLELRLAKARVREARALRGVVAASLWPTVNGGGTYFRYRTSENAFASSSSTSTSGGTSSSGVTG